MISDKCPKKGKCAHWHLTGGFCADLKLEVKKALEEGKKCPNYRALSKDKIPSKVGILKGTPVAIMSNGEVIMSDGSKRDPKDSPYKDDPRGWKYAGLKGDKTA